LWNRYTLTCLPTDHQAFCEARNTLRSYTRQLKHNFELGICNDTGSNHKRFWQYVNSRLDTKSTINDLIDESNECVSEDVGKAELLNNYFAVFLLVKTLILYLHLVHLALFLLLAPLIFL